MAQYYALSTASLFAFAIRATHNPASGAKSFKKLACMSICRIARNTAAVVNRLATRRWLNRSARPQGALREVADHGRRAGEGR